MSGPLVYCIENTTHKHKVLASWLLPDFLSENVINQILHTSHSSVSKNSAHKQCVLRQDAEIIGLKYFAHEKDGYI